MIMLRVSPLVLALFALATSSPAADPAARAEADRIFAATGVKGGFVVHLGAGDARLTAALRKNASFQVQGLERDAAKVTAARERLLAEKGYGDVAVDVWREGQLPYIDNLVNLLVAEDLGGVPLEEVTRVLTPNGVAYVKQAGQWQKIVKPRPREMDDWTHYFYSAEGNATSHDLLVAPPERLQWVGSPRWSRHHDRMSSLSAEVSSGGRLFYIMDEGSRISALLPPHWQLTARDAFNGTILWKQDIAHWQPHLWPLKSGPTQLTRRLVGDGERIFVTLAIDAPVSELDGATGEKLRDFEQTKGTEEILHAGGVLYALVNPKVWSLEDFAPKFNTGDQKRVETEFNWDQQPRNLVAIDSTTGKVLWQKKDAKIAPLTLATDGKRLLFHDGDKLIDLDAKTGEQRWASAPAGKRSLFEYNYGPRVLLHDGLVLYAGGDGAQKAYDGDTGKELWTAPHNKSGYRSPEDLIVAGGLVWNAPTTSGNMSGEFIGRDPKTGEVKSQFAPDIDTYWFHHRCYLAKATDRFILPSRTGIEFVDIKAKHWDINHWVRSACLYGTLPANGLTYAGPHNCACYPEAKLDGINALAPHGTTPHPAPPAEDQRLERGPAYGMTAGAEPDPLDWPTYRHDATRSGFTDQALAKDLGKAWDLPIGGRLSPLTIAAGRVFVAQIDAHTVHALDASTGKPLWHFIAGGRVDSPPTFWKGRVLFGSKDGSVYCLRAADGTLAWRYRASSDRRHFAFEQCESVWPIPGSVLVENDAVSFVAGHSVFLDGGLRFFRLDAATGRKLAEQNYDDKDPDTGGDLQDRLKTLQMPVGSNDILGSDGKWTYLRTQKIGADGKRVDIGPVSGNAIEQGAAQKGEGAHLFAPMGFLDDSWFHRSFWVYGKSFAGGHNGYFQAAKYTPTGRILVFDQNRVFGYGREPQYNKWTTTLEHQLFSASRVAPDVEAEKEAGPKKAGKGGKAAQTSPNVRFPDNPRLDPTDQPITVEAWVLPDGGDGVIVAHGGPINGYALTLRDGAPTFHVRTTSTLTTATAQGPLGEGWHHLAGVLDAEKGVHIYVDGLSSGDAKAPSLLTKKPAQALEFGADSGGPVGDYTGENPFAGLLDEVAIYHRALSPEEIRARALTADARSAKEVALAVTFDKGDARDDSGGGVNGVVSGADTGKGKNGAAVWFRKATPTVAKGPAGKAGKATGKAAGTFVSYDWTSYVPVITRAMAMAGKSVLISGPPDVVDEEYAFERLTQKDPAVQRELLEQDAALNGERGAVMQVVNSETGEISSDFKLERSPVWDGMAIAHGRIYVATTDGKVQCYGK